MQKSGSDLFQPLFFVLKTLVWRARSRAKKTARYAGG